MAPKTQARPAALPCHATSPCIAPSPSTSPRPQPHAALAMAAGRGHSLLKRSGPFLACGPTQPTPPLASTSHHAPPGVPQKLCQLNPGLSYAACECASEGGEGDGARVVQRGAVWCTAAAKAEGEQRREAQIEVEGGVDGDLMDSPKRQGDGQHVVGAGRATEPLLQ
eukprot:CAMPEP_0119495044 /NCGR_PEP_ID=MMETSP1344-20130328/18803_1 /TAXON_ID=236787 /ORGANISM="Florenciella parvula, Strain CCMP2471" /LENGTH=166 /DNA_ID=CAMNT_0007530601 /DNA_START=249 /DNA_END=752 /DNA_ORIENTATION=+